MKRRPIYYWIDHTATYGSNSGMQRVTRSLARALIDNGEDVRFVRWSWDRKALVLATRDELLALSRFGGPQFDEVTLEQYPARGEVLPLDAAQPSPRGWLVVPEVTHITSQPRAATLDALLYARHLGLRSAFVFYDAIPLKLGEYAEQAPAHATYMQQIALADAVLPISRFSSEDLVEYLTDFVSFGASTLPVVRPVTLAAELMGCRRMQEADELTILSVGTLEPRKNQLALIEAFDRLCADHPEMRVRLVLVGHLDPALAEGVLGNRNPRISYREYVDETELARLFRQSYFTVYPSVEEGFGLPILESLWHGKPCICADFGAMEEVARDGGCLRIDVRSPERIRLAIEELLTDRELRARLVHEAWARKLKTWTEYAREVTDLLDEISSVPRVERLLYWVDHTCEYPNQSGIQRVVRLLARSLLAEGVELVPVKWDRGKGVFVSPTRQDLEHLARWSGPAVEAWSEWDATAHWEWLLIPELTTYQPGPDLAQVTEHAASLGMRSAIVFYDALPFTMKSLYPAEATATHRSYMIALSGFHRVLAISEASRQQLRRFWIEERCRLIGLDDRLVTARLSGELPGSTRALTPPSGEDEVIRILSVGTIEPRKNQITMIKAFLKAAARSGRKAELTLVGSAPFPDLLSEIQEHADRNPAISWVGNVDDQRLRALYASCHFTIYPSLAEGFGIPVLESLWYGRPCICRDEGALAEAAQEGGCLVVETTDEDQLADAIGRLIDDDAERARLGRAAGARTFKTWQAYGREVVTVLSRDLSAHRAPMTLPAERSPRLRYPLLSICITTYNRAAWLEVSLRQLATLVAPYQDLVELVVCDNASFDQTPKIGAAYQDVPGFHYYRNPVNVGMLGNLRETVHHARGRFVWILGDDDIVKAGSIEKILRVILEHPTVSLIYLNYAYTRHESPKANRDLDSFLASAMPITLPNDDRHAPIAALATMSENFFTAIYCLIFRRDHAIRAYSQDIAGPPFSSLLTCVPTAHYVCHHLFHEMGYWLGDPSVVVNMNVSWIRYAPVWVLDRLPELYDLAEMAGAAPGEVDRWRVHNLDGALHYLGALSSDEGAGILEHFSFDRFIQRHIHLQEFRSRLDRFMATYQAAYEAGRVRSGAAPSELLARYGIAPTGK